MQKSYIHKFIDRDIREKLFSPFGVQLLYWKIFIRLISIDSLLVTYQDEFELMISQYQKDHKHIESME